MDDAEHPSGDRRNIGGKLLLCFLRRVSLITLHSECGSSSRPGRFGQRQRCGAAGRSCAEGEAGAGPGSDVRCDTTIFPDPSNDAGKASEPLHCVDCAGCCSGVVVDRWWGGVLGAWELQEMGRTLTSLTTLVVGHAQ